MRDSAAPSTTPGLRWRCFRRCSFPRLGKAGRRCGRSRPISSKSESGRPSPTKSAVAVTVFRNNVHDRYVIVFPPPPPPRYLNLGSCHTEGVEITADTAPRKDLALFAGISLLRTTPDGLPYAPECTFTGGLNWQIAAGWLLSTDGVYVSSMHEATEARVAGATNPVVVGAHFLLNARLARRFSWGAHTRDPWGMLHLRRESHRPQFRLPARLSHSRHQFHGWSAVRTVRRDHASEPPVVSLS